jgi:hypothetical protein
VNTTVSLQLPSGHRRGRLDERAARTPFASDPVEAIWPRLEHCLKDEVHPSLELGQKKVQLPLGVRIALQRQLSGSIIQGATKPRRVVGELPSQPGERHDLRRGSKR